MDINPVNRDKHATRIDTRVHPQQRFNGSPGGHHRAVAAQNRLVVRYGTRALLATLATVLTAATVQAAAQPAGKPDNVDVVAGEKPDAKLLAAFRTQGSVLKVHYIFSNRGTGPIALFSVTKTGEPLAHARLARSDEGTSIVLDPSTEVAPAGAPMPGSLPVARVEAAAVSDGDIELALPDAAGGSHWLRLCLAYHSFEDKWAQRQGNVWQVGFPPEEHATILCTAWVDPVKHAAK